MWHGRCNASEHQLSRRSILGGLLGLGAGMLLPGGFASSAGTAAKPPKRLLVLFQGGGLSQLESWDPKPDTNTGGPCLPISTSVPGLQISEWLPHTARVMHHLLLLRGMSTGENNHGPGAYLMTCGRREGDALVYPHMGCVANKFLTPGDYPLPGLVSVEGNYGAGSAFLGAQFGAVKIEVDKAPENLDLPAGLDPEADRRRQAFRQAMNGRFGQRRGSPEANAYAESFKQARQLMANKQLFDFSKEDPKQIDRYGTHPLGRKCLMALRLLEQGVTCVNIGHPGYDTHAENFNVQLDLIQQFDQPFACLIEDLAESGLLEETVVVCTGEFGRTPNINRRMGRDHWSGSWSCVVAGGRFPRGAVYGKTSETGNSVEEGKIDAAQFFHTVMSSLGIDAKQSHLVDGQEVPIGDPAAGPIQEILV